MTRPEQLPEYLRVVVATFIQREADLPPGILVTVTRVEVPGHRRNAAVWVSVLPEEQTDTVLKRLREILYDLQGEVNRKVTSLPVPRIHFRVDTGPARSARIDELSQQL